jgi:hypothetical protein
MRRKFSSSATFKAVLRSDFPALSYHGMSVAELALLEFGHQGTEMRKKKIAGRRKRAAEIRSQNRTPYPPPTAHLSDLAGSRKFNAVDAAMGLMATTNPAAHQTLPSSLLIAVRGIGKTAGIASLQLQPGEWHAG